MIKQLITKQVMIDRVIEYEIEVNYLSYELAEDYVNALSDEELKKAYEDVLNNWAE